MKYTDAYIKSDAFLDTFEWRKVRIKKKVLPKNNLKVRKDVMKELLTVLTTWR